MVQELALWPEQLLKFGARHNRTGALQEDRQKARGLFRYSEAFYPTKKIARRMIKFEVQKGHQLQLIHEKTLHE
jgi:hypothetical protein